MFFFDKPSAGHVKSLETKDSDFSAQTSGCHSFLPCVPDDVENAFRGCGFERSAGRYQK